MKCYVCGEAEMVESAAQIPFDLPGFAIVGAKELRCPVCGEVGESVHRLGPLMDLVADILIQKQSALTGREVRFLRENVGLTQQDLADRLGTTKSTICHWEKSQPTEMGDKFVRLFMLIELKKQQGFSQIDFVFGHRFGKAQAPIVKISPKEDGTWQVAAA